MAYLSHDNAFSEHHQDETLEVEEARMSLLEEKAIYSWSNGLHNSI